MIVQLFPASISDAEAERRPPQNLSYGVEPARSAADGRLDTALGGLLAAGLLLIIRNGKRRPGAWSGAI